MASSRKEKPRMEGEEEAAPKTHEVDADAEDNKEKEEKEEQREQEEFSDSEEGDSDGEEAPSSDRSYDEGSCGESYGSYSEDERYEWTRGSDEEGSEEEEEERLDQPFLSAGHGDSLFQAFGLSPAYRDPHFVTPRETLSGSSDDSETERDKDEDEEEEEESESTSRSTGSRPQPSSDARTLANEAEWERSRRAVEVEENAEWGRVLVGQPTYASVADSTRTGADKEETGEFFDADSDFGEEDGETDWQLGAYDSASMYDLEPPQRGISTGRRTEATSREPNRLPSPSIHRRDTASVLSVAASGAPKTSAPASESEREREREFLRIAGDIDEITTELDYTKDLHGVFGGFDDLDLSTFEEAAPPSVTSAHRREHTNLFPEYGNDGYADEFSYDETDGCQEEQRGGHGETHVWITFENIEEWYKNVPDHRTSSVSRAISCLTSVPWAPAAHPEDREYRDVARDPARQESRSSNSGSFAEEAREILGRNPLLTHISLVLLGQRIEMTGESGLRIYQASRFSEPAHGERAKSSLAYWCLTVPYSVAEKILARASALTRDRGVTYPAAEVLTYSLFSMVSGFFSGLFLSGVQAYGRRTEAPTAQSHTCVSFPWMLLADARVLPPPVQADGGGGGNIVRWSKAFTSLTPLRFLTLLLTLNSAPHTTAACDSLIRLERKSASVFIAEIATQGHARFH